MLNANAIYKKIEILPLEQLQEVSDFIGYLKQKYSNTIPETMILSESALAKE